MKTILGIDVGATGALAFYDGTELLIWDMPVNERNKTKRVDCHKLHDILKNNYADHAYVEQVNAFGMGVSSAYNFGWSCGTIEAVLSCLNIPFTYVTPQVWKKVMQCPKEKDASRMRATQLLPAHKNNWDRVKDHGRAESALIALYGYNK